MSKPHLILWGGSWEPLDRPLTLEDIDSHAKVYYYFLKKALLQHFSISNIENFEAIETVPDLIRNNTVGVLSTFQGGFGQLYKRMPSLYKTISFLLKDKKFSIIDEVPLRVTNEDHLFTVIPAGKSLKGFIKSLLNPAHVHELGWCADPHHCYPQNNDKFTIFVDHAHYAGSDYTTVILNACRALNEKYDFRVLIQTNNGVEDLEISKLWHNEQYVRANKIPWPEMMEAYRKTDLFCLTHIESAGLSSIEAAMCGARLLIPKLNGVSFINRALIHDRMDVLMPKCNVADVKKAISDSIKKGIDRKANHAQLSVKNNWSVAAKNIAKALIG
jgi:hypothetical protein